MKQNVFTIFLFLCLCFMAQGQDLQYRIVAVGTSQWMDPKQEEAVHATIDKIAADGYNVISTGSFYFMPQYFVDYYKSPYPEAQLYTSEKIKKNIEIFRSNLQYAKQ